MSYQMRAHFEADPENKTDNTIKRREIIGEMQKLLKQTESCRCFIFKRSAQR
jgi:hypothetical protein